MSILHQFGRVSGPIASPKGQTKPTIEKKPRAADKIREGLEEAIEHVKTAPIESLRDKIVEIETKNTPPPKPGKGEFQKVKKGRPKKGDQNSKLVPVTILVDTNTAAAMKNAKMMQDTARLALANAFLPSIKKS